MSVSEIFGSHVFDLNTMKKKLPKATYNALQDVVAKGGELAPNDADVIATAMMDWAIEKGVTHYTHWFHPMTGLTAQKHDAFFSFDSNHNPIDRFSGSQLIQSEPDASSFPSGGMRSTFEARGYTAWDPSSPVFLMMNGEVHVLCIPSVFFSYTGHALDKKTPLMKSNKSISQAASYALERLTGKKLRLDTTVGVEQEYFLVDREYYDQRPDLLMAKRTLIGSRPPKGQQMEDHYFGSIKDRVLAFMQDVEERLYKLGVPCKTRHNEVAPHQFEMAPIFETANLAADHNQVAMEILKKVAREHGLAAILHEKPFADVNGSGKHVNWSMQAEDGTNLLEPGKEPHKNSLFLYFLVAVINAVHKRGGVLRSTIAGPGNDHRLGANEAPPAIMSVFLGSHLTGILDKLESSQEICADTVASIDLGLSELPSILMDTTDRNRTSPFAFTGNKFEFRAVGSDQSISIPVAFLNAAVAESLNEMNAALAKIDDVNEKTLFTMLRPFITACKTVRFEGNNYSEEWAEEAARRGLPNHKTTPEALSVWEDESVRKFVHESGILNLEEMDAHHSVRLENYSKTILIEAELMLRLIETYVLPAAYGYQGQLARSLVDLSTALPGAAALDTQKAHLGLLASTIAEQLETRSVLERATVEVQSIADEKEQAMACAKQLLPLMGEVRAVADHLENLVDTAEWRLPSYQDLLFLM